jgi:uncharacterized protein YjbI with pentapeptide repeats
MEKKSKLRKNSYKDLLQFLEDHRNGVNSSTKEGKRAELKIISDTELQQILEDHRKWVNSSTKEGKRAELATAFLPSVDLSGATLSGADLRRANLCGANLSGANLRRTDLGYADLNVANLCNANLSGAYLIGAEFFEANLSGAKLRRVNLRNADLRGADLSGANLSSSILNYSILSATNLSGADLSYASIGNTIFSYVDLSTVKGLGDLTHSAPSSIGIETVFISKGKIPEIFYRGAGLDENFINHIPSFVNQPIQFYSCFISYSHKDKLFAQRLHDQLQGKGIRCWLDEHQMLPGDDIYEQVDRGIRHWDKVLLCCSESSLTSWWVDNELSTAFKKEQRLMKDRGKKVLSLIPLNIDGYMFSDQWESGKKTQVLERLAADFTGWEKDNDKFEKQFERVVKALRTEEVGREIPPEPQL